MKVGKYGKKCYKFDNDITLYCLLSKRKKG